MPLSQSGSDVLKSMKDQYGDKKGKEVFYASINKGKKGSSKWEKKRKTEKHKSYPTSVMKAAKGGGK